MYDDVLSAATLTGAVGLIAAALLSVWPPTPDPAQSAVAAGQAKAAPSQVPKFEPVAAMPVYELPRVVVTGNRSREGDMMAANLVDAPTPAAFVQPPQLQRQQPDRAK